MPAPSVLAEFRAAWLPHDGKVIPKEVALALGKGATAGGAQVCEHVRVLDLIQTHGRIAGVTPAAIAILRMHLRRGSWGSPPRTTEPTSVAGS